MPTTGPVLGSRAVGASSVALGAGWVVRHATAPTVRGWRASQAPTVTAGPLRSRVVGSGEGALLLLHGIVGCGAYFGACYDALARGRRLVVPDLLGFGDSYRSEAPSGYDLEAHLDALDALVEELGLHGPLTVAGHSMGAVLALQWAARRDVEVERVVAMSAPLYTSAEEGMAHVRGMGRLEELMALDGPVARTACAWMCRHRTTAGWVAAALKPHLPVPVARRGVLHTWPSYLGSMEHVVLSSSWPAALSTLADAGIPVELAAGAQDRVPVAGRADGLAGQYASVTSRTHPTADHDLPLADPAWCRRLLAGDLAAR